MTDREIRDATSTLPGPETPLEALRQWANEYCMGSELERQLLEVILERFIVLADERLMTPCAVASAAAPEGWRLVPLKADAHMKNVYNATQAERIVGGDSQGHAQDAAYRAMLDAAPMPPRDRSEG